MSSPIPTSQTYFDEHGICMEILSETAYERTIRSVRSFCYFLASLYTPDDIVLEPPENGWDEITEEKFAPLGKSKKVITLLRNMTYLRYRYDMFPHTSLASYIDRRVLNEISSESMGSIEVSTHAYKKVTADGVGLGHGRNRDMWGFFLEATYGIVYWPGCPYGDTEFGLRLPVSRDDWDDEWMNHAAWPVEEFFEFLKSKIRDLDLIPYDRHLMVATVVSSGKIRDRLIPILRQIYQEHGWPENFRKDECAAAVAKLNIGEITDYGLPS